MTMMHEDGGLSTIQDKAAQAAFLRLAGGFNEAGFRSAPKSGFIPALKLYDGADRYLFSLSPASTHVRVYLRKPAIDALPSLGAAAREQFGSAARTNPAGETVINVRSPAEAESLLGWLLPQQPLPLVTCRNGI